MHGEEDELDESNDEVASGEWPEDMPEDAKREAEQWLDDYAAHLYQELKNHFGK